MIQNILNIFSIYTLGVATGILISIIWDIERIKNHFERLSKV